jgi:hypothetical protein
MTLLVRQEYKNHEHNGEGCRCKRTNFKIDKQLLGDNYIINYHSSTLFGLSIDKSGVQYKLFIKSGDTEPILLHLLTFKTLI